MAAAGPGDDFAAAGGRFDEGGRGGVWNVGGAGGAGGERSEREARDKRATQRDRDREKARAGSAGRPAYGNKTKWGSRKEKGDDRAGEGEGDVGGRPLASGPSDAPDALLFFTEEEREWLLNDSREREEEAALAAASGLSSTGGTGGTVGRGDSDQAPYSLSRAAAKARMDLVRRLSSSTAAVAPPEPSFSTSSSTSSADNAAPINRFIAEDAATVAAPAAGAEDVANATATSEGGGAGEGAGALLPATSSVDDDVAEVTALFSGLYSVDSEPDDDDDDAGDGHATAAAPAAAAAPRAWAPAPRDGDPNPNAAAAPSRPADEQVEVF